MDADMHFTGRITRTGGGLVLRIPSDNVRAFGLEKGMYVDVSVRFIRPTLEEMYRSPRRQE